jgi:hypothetical protein
MRFSYALPTPRTACLKAACLPQVRMGIKGDGFQTAG